MGRFECVPAFPALDFPGQPSVAGLAAILEGGVCHQLLAAPQPNVRQNGLVIISERSLLLLV